MCGTSTARPPSGRAAHPEGGRAARRNQGSCSNALIRALMSASSAAIS
ncbi:hypothetical protein BN940_16651 [Castellaniella defragrans 65Phen]|uniref:Uncharacterized protein n=1 Tax=Castellaniella defragrans (strain DSM 12143 / CCUG 39792 / 65Phen) TaxID=1437824 RepID=W8X119_CASD6|nr:hypothetical protein BN940_16651 [Castellaniella defragrans 65Phen]